MYPIGEFIHWTEVPSSSKPAAYGAADEVWSQSLQSWAAQQEFWRIVLMANMRHIRKVLLLFLQVTNQFILLCKYSHNIIVSKYCIVICLP